MDRYRAVGIAVWVVAWPLHAFGQEGAEPVDPADTDAVAGEVAGTAVPDTGAPVPGAPSSEVRRPLAPNADDPSERVSMDGAAIMRWVTLGTSGVVLLSGAVFFGVGQREFESEDFPPGTPWRGEPQEEYEEGRDKITAGILLMVLGGLGTAAAFAWFLSAEDDEPDSGESVELRGGPGAVAVAWRFR